MDKDSTERKYEKALKRLEVIFDSIPNDHTFEEAKMLAKLIEDYETESFPFIENFDRKDIVYGYDV